jgi:hypothetical protein
MELTRKTVTNAYKIEVYLNGKSNHKSWSHKIVQIITLYPEGREPYANETRHHANVDKYNGSYEVEVGMQYLDRPVEVLIKKQ